MADACVHLMAMDEAEFASQFNAKSSPLINIGSGSDCSIVVLARLVKEVVGFTGELVFDSSKPDGSPRKLLDVSRVKQLGWQSRIELKEGIERVYRWYEDEL